MLTAPALGFTVTGPEVIKKISCSNQPSTKFQLLQRERILSFKSSSLRYRKSLLPHKASSLECYFFITYMCLLPCFCCRLLTFNFLKNSLRNTFRVSNSLDPDQDPQNFRKGYQKTTNVATDKERF